MRILVVCQYYYPEPFRITDICQTLVQMGHEVTVLTGLPNYPEGHVLDEYRRGQKRNENINGVNVIRCFEVGRGRGHLRLFLNYLSFVFSGSLRAIKLENDFDVVYVNQLSPVMMAIPAIIYKRKNNKKLLLYCLDLWPESLAAGGIRNDSIIYKLFLRISRRIYQSADKILVSSAMFKEYFDNVLQISSESIDHLPQYAEDLFSVRTNEEENIAYDDSKYNFVFAGNIGEMQSVETIIKAANLLRDHDEVFFHIVGDGAKLEECKELAMELELENIRFYGRLPIEEMLSFYAMASAMLITLKDNPAISYTLPGKIQSYMAAGKPVIGAINGETARVIKESGCGMCCAAEDYGALAWLLLDFCNSNQKAQMGQKSKSYYMEQYRKELLLSLLDDSLTALAI